MNLATKNIPPTLVTEFGTPLYVYSADVIRHRAAALKNALAPLNPHIHFSVKANSNRAILQLIHQLGFGFDVVSGGELARLQAAGIPTADVSFAGVGKTEPEIRRALAADIGYFTVESGGELQRIAQMATEMRQPARAVLRLNPNVDAHTHKFITTGHAENKFGMDAETAAELWRQFRNHPAVTIEGIHLHIGSQVREIEPYVEAAQKGLAFIAARRAEGLAVRRFDMGGGFGIGYQGEADLPLAALAAALKPMFADHQSPELVFEPGRWLVAPAGVLLMTVQYTKKSGRKTFVITDAGMHTMIRPALYGGQHRIVPLKPPATGVTPVLCDVVGPVCESTDFLAQDRLLPPVQPGDVLALLDAGAYGMVMASNYNSHPRPAEVLLDGENIRLVRRRESLEDLWSHET